MAFARHNIEKRRLIELVRLNPILWDCRLPHYKRSDKKKIIKWNELGRIFNVSGERVQRTFTSLREIFRRELNHEKLLGNRFKSKWEFYEAMTFLREVIRERKSRERSKANEAQQQQQQQQQQTNNNNNSSNINNNNNNHNNNSNNNNGSNGLDEYQYFAPNDPNNPNNKLQQQQSSAIYASASSAPAQTQQQLQLQSGVVVSLHGNALNALQEYSTSNDGHTPAAQTPTLTAVTATATTTPTTMVTTTNTVGVQQTPLQHQQQQQQQQEQFQQQHLQQKDLDSPYSPHALSTLHSTSTSPSIYIKDEPDSQEDETISLASTTTPSRHERDYPLTVPLPLPLPLPSAQSPKRTRSYARRTLKESARAEGGGTLQVRRFSLTQNAGIVGGGGGFSGNVGGGGGGVSDGIAIRIGNRHTRQPSATTNPIIEEDEIDDFEGDLEIDEVDADINDADVVLLDDDMHTHGLGGGGGGGGGGGIGMDGGVNGDRLSVTSTMTMLKPHQLTAREVLYTKFGDFLAARLNTLHETVANDLMNKILLLIAEK